MFVYGTECSQSTSADGSDAFMEHFFSFTTEIESLKFVTQNCKSQ